MDRPSSSSSSPMRPLPVLPAVGEFGQEQEGASRSISKRLSDTMGRLSMQSNKSKSKRASNVPRPEPIPIPEPVMVPATTAVTQQGHTVDSSGEGPSSSSSTGSALASVNAELIQHGPGNGTNTNPGSPSSPRETNQLLADQPQPTRPLRGRPMSSADIPNSARPTHPPSTYDPSNRPYSSADAWATPSDNTSQQPATRSPSSDSLLRPTQMQMQMARSRSTNFGVNTPSPLNPNSASTSNPAFPPPPLPPPRRPASTSASRPASTSSRPGSMVLYRLVGIGDDFNPQMASLSPPVTTNSRRASRFSTLSSGNSTYSIFGDSKYPVPAREEGSTTPPPSGAFLPYEYDPSWDQDAPDDAEDVLHRPDEPGQKPVRMGGFNVRGMCNVFVMVTILTILIGIFVLYPVVSHYDHAAQASLFSGTDGNTGNTGGTNNTATMRTALIDPDTPDSAKSWTGVDGTAYQLVFSDEFKTEGRTFGQGDDNFWEAVGLNDAKDSDLNWYDPGQVTTKGGYLQITMEKKTNGQYAYTSGMLQSWNKFCFTGGYVEISVSLPGSSTTAGFTPQAYTMGNLARSGYAASEDGVWPYSYNLCDANIEAAQGGSARTNTLPGQRLSACTCLAEMTAGEHPGPAGTTNPVTGRGSPQIDILGYLDENLDTGMISQSYRFAPFNTDKTPTTGRGVTIESVGDTQLNPFPGTNAEQVISALNNVSATSYQANGGQFSTYGYQHVTDTTNQAQAILHWVEGGNSETFRVTGTALAADDVVGQRLISNEPMYLVFALALSQLASTVDLTPLNFPGIFLIDYVRVYQIQGQSTQVTCDPTNFPTKDYINKHSNAYTDPTLTTWALAGYTDPTNNLTGTC